jgi:carbamoyl-phosphate synthase large subunit
MIFPLKRLADLGFTITATGGTADVLRRNAVEVSEIRKVHIPGEGMDTVEAILGGHIDLIVNTPYGVGSRLDGYEIRTAAVVRGVPCITTVQGLGAAVQGIEALISGDIGVRSLQEHARDLAELRALHAGRVQASAAGSL